MAKIKLRDRRKVKAVKALGKLEKQSLPVSGDDFPLQVSVSEIAVNVAMKPGGETFIDSQVFVDLRAAIRASDNAEFKRLLAEIRNKLQEWPDYGWES